MILHHQFSCGGPRPQSDERTGSTFKPVLGPVFSKPPKKEIGFYRAEGSVCPRTATWAVGRARGACRDRGPRRWQLVGDANISALHATAAAPHLPCAAPDLPHAARTPRASPHLCSHSRALVSPMDRLAPSYTATRTLISSFMLVASSHRSHTLLTCWWRFGFKFGIATV